MSFESCFGGFVGSKSAPAAMSGLPTFVEAIVNGKVAPKTAIGTLAKSRSHLMRAR